MNKNSEKILPLATSTWNDDEIDALHSVIKSNKFTMGEKVSEYEANFASYFGARYCVMTNSGSSANLLMVASLFYTNNEEIRLKPGDEVIVPAVSWSTTYFPLMQYGLKLRFVDIDQTTLNFNLIQLKQNINEKTKLIFCVNLLGNSNDFTAIKQIIGSENILLIEDNCESMGAKFENRFTGNFGLMGSFSTYFSHHISTMEGGCVITDNEELYQILLSLRAHGWTRNLPSQNKITKLKNSESFYESFNFVLPGYNLRPLEMSAAVGICQLNKLDFLLEGRRKNAQLFKELFDKIEHVKIQREVGVSSWFGFSLIFDKPETLSRKQAIEKLKKNGFEFRPIVAGNFTKNPVIKYCDVEEINQRKLPNSNLVHECGLFIGNHHFDISAQLIKLKEVIGG